MTLNPVEIGYDLSRKKQHMEEKIPRSVPTFGAISFNIKVLYSSMLQFWLW